MPQLSYPPSIARAARSVPPRGHPTLHTHAMCAAVLRAQEGIEKLEAAVDCKCEQGVGRPCACAPCGTAGAVFLRPAAPFVDECVSGKAAGAGKYRQRGLGKCGG
eukprot:67772-Chlamydomonas_euryale.AAC.5